MSNDIKQVDTRKTIEELRAAHREALRAVKAAEESIPKLREKARLAYSEIEQWQKDVMEGDRVYITNPGSYSQVLAVITKAERFSGISGETLARPILKNGSLGKEKRVTWRHDVKRIETPIEEKANL